MNVLLVIIILILVAIISFIIGRSSVKTDGLFIINDTDEETTRWIIDVHIDPATIPNKKVVRLKVKEGDV